MSVAFSGHSTTSGTGARAARTAAGRSLVAWAWFAVTCGLLTWADRFRARGTFPWTAATAAVGDPPDGSTGTSPIARTKPVVITAIPARRSLRRTSRVSM